MMQKQERRYARIAGISIIVMALAAGFSYGYVHDQLITDGPEQTMHNLISHRSLFWAGLSGWSIIFLTDLIVSFMLFGFFRTTSRQVSLVTALLRIVYTGILGVAIAALAKIMVLLPLDPDGADSSKAQEVVTQITLFEKWWSIGLIIFGFHLVGLGYLAVKSIHTPRILGYLLFIGGASYTLIHGARQLAAFDPAVIRSLERLLSLPMALAEILLAFWLIYLGLRKQKVVI